MILRISGSMIAGVVITIALLYLMQSLISNTKSALT